MDKDSRTEEKLQPSLGARAARAGKWSALSQVATKLVSPVTTMLLARLLTPADFGVVASATMITSLADLFTDAGFQQYIIQREFDGKRKRDLFASVAFWTNLALSLALVAAIAWFRDPIAEACGSAGYGDLLALSALSVPLTSMTSVQTALFQKELEFGPLFTARVSSTVANLVVSAGMAFLGFGAWSIVAGTLSSTLLMAVVLTVKSDWKPGFSYSFRALGTMLSYGVWVILESLATWVGSWAGTFIVGRTMDSTRLGYYKTATSMGNSITGLFSGSFAPVAFTALAKVKHNDAEFERVFYKMLKYFAMCLVPFALAVFVYRKAVTLVILGSQWEEAETLLGLWVLTGCFVVVFGYLCSEAYRAKGVPRYSVLVQVLYLVPFLPALYFSSLQGFECMSVVMPAVRLSLVIVNVAVAKLALGLSPVKMLRTTRWSYVQAAIAVVPGFVAVSLTDSLAVALLFAALSVVIYIVLLFGVRETRGDAINLLDKVGLGRFVPAFARKLW